MAKRFWTKVEDNLMYDKFADTQTRELCKILDRSYRSVASRANFLGLKKSEAFLKSDLSGRLTKLSELGKAYRFPKGNIPANKGKKMSKSQYEKCKKTMFKKGQQPKNTYKQDGVIVVRYDHKKRENSRPYKWIRISVNKWKPLHRYIWKQVHGKIPKGHIIIFKDGNTMNCVIENLECISKQENMLRNSKHDIPIEIIPTKLLINKINKKIQQHEK